MRVSVFMWWGFPVIRDSAALPNTPVSFGSPTSSLVEIVVPAFRMGWGQVGVWRMANLYGIDSEDVCRATIDGLLEMTRRAEKAMDQEKIYALRSRLEVYYGKGNTQTGLDHMSGVESAFFWPAVREAYVKAPNLASPTTWLEGLYDVASSLRYYRPKEKRDV